MLKIRPRWRRLAYWPRLVYGYWMRSRIDLPTSIRLANMAVMFKGKWADEWEDE